MITDLFARLSDVLMEAMPADLSLVAVLDDDGGLLFEKVRGCDGDGGGPAGREALRLLAAEAAGSARPFLSDDFRPGTSGDRGGLARLAVRVLCFPWKVRGRPGGSAFFGRSEEGRPFAGDDLEFVSMALIPAISRMETERRRRDAGPAAGRWPFSGGSAAAARANTMIRSLGGTETPVFICGESGTGKELAARALHQCGRRREGPFVAVNCAAIPETLLESELFGCARGAFTGAVRDKAGLMEEASGGTFFLDEVGDLPIALQVKLLRVLEEKKIRRIGETRLRPVDVRFVSATNKDLDAEVARGAFRPDLYYRLKIVSLELPPLRSRREDIHTLVDMFLEDFSVQMGRPKPYLSPGALELLAGYDWPGNVRELQNEIQRCLVLAGGSPVIGEEFISARINPEGRARPAAGPGLGRARAEFERRFVLEALDRCGWNRTRTAGEIGLSRQGLFKLMKKHGLDNGI